VLEPKAVDVGYEIGKIWRRAAAYRGGLETVEYAHCQGRAVVYKAGERAMTKMIAMLFVVAGIVTGCESMSSGQKGAVAGGALGSGIGMVAGGSFGQVVGAGLIGGAVGYVGGSAVGNR